MKENKSLNEQVDEIFSGTQVMVLIEAFRNDVKIVAEGLTSLREEVKAFKEEMYEFRDEMYVFKGEMYSFKNQTEENFKFVAKQLLKIEHEIEKLYVLHNKKADKKWVLAEIKRLEKEIQDLKKIVKIGVYA